MQDALVELFSSKKFILALLGLIAGIAGRFGLHMDPNQVFLWISPLIAAIIGQGIADHGKSAAEVHAAASQPAQPKGGAS